MRIGLLTYHHSASYGATLQTYATCMALQKLGHEVEIIDFRINENKSIFYKIAFCAKEFSTNVLWKRIYPKLSPFYPDIEKLKKANLNYDCLMVGSDQTWNPNISQEHCLAFFLNFGADEVKRISYASSFGVSEWPGLYQHLVPDIKGLLSRFSALSVREEIGQKLLSETFGYEATLVVDPTMLIEDFSEISGEISSNSMLNAFIMNRSTEQLKRVLELGKAVGKKPVMTSTIFPYQGYSYCYPPSIGQWLRYIGGAEFLVVDSFHALVFCLKYHRQFIVITPDNGRNSRLLTLLHLVGLEDRFFYDNDLNIPYNKMKNTVIDYQIIDKRIQEEKDKSFSYLEKSLEL